MIFKIYDLTTYFFLKDHTENVVKKLSPEPFLQNQNWAYLWTNGPKFYIFYILCHIEVYQNILKLSCRPLAFTSHNSFTKQRRGVELVSLFHFLHDFGRKIFLLFYDQKVKTKIWILWERKELLKNIFRHFEGLSLK